MLVCLRCGNTLCFWFQWFSTWHVTACPMINEGWIDSFMQVQALFSVSGIWQLAPHHARCFLWCHVAQQTIWLLKVDQTFGLPEPNLSYGGLLAVRYKRISASCMDPSKSVSASVLSRTVTLAPCDHRRAQLIFWHAQPNFSWKAQKQP